MPEERRPNRLVESAKEQGAKEVTNEQPKRLSDMRQSRSDGAVSCEPFLGQEILIKSFEEVPSIFDERNTYLVLTVHTKEEGDIRIRCSGSLVRRRLLENREYLPFLATIIKKGNTYVLE